MFVAENINKGKIKNKPNLLINLIFGFFPISFVFGSLFVSINLTLFCCIGIFYLRSKILKTKLDFVIKVIFLFFLLILFSTSFSFVKSFYFEGYEYVHLIRLAKSILFFRFFLMLIIVYLLNELDILNFRYFLLSAAFISILVSLDIIYQYIFGFDMIGFKSHVSHNTGFFGEERIAGGYIQRFSLFSIFFIAFSLKDKISAKYILTIIIICILGTGILFSGNRMPLVLFLGGLFLIFLFDVKLKKIVTISFISLLIIFKFIISSDDTIKNLYISYYGNSKDVLISAIPNIFKKNQSQKYNENKKSKIKNRPNYQSVQNRIFLTAIDTWKKNKMLGNGIKSFRIDCAKLRPKNILIKDEINLAETFLLGKKNRLCSNHPHNYYLEILTETGIVGLFISLIIAILFVSFFFKNFKYFKGNSVENFILLSAIISLTLELFPLKSTGSLFTTNNATYLTLISSILISHKKLLKTNLKF